MGDLNYSEALISGIKKLARDLIETKAKQKQSANQETRQFYDMELVRKFFRFQAVLDFAKNIRIDSNEVKNRIIQTIREVDAEIIKKIGESITGQKIKMELIDFFKSI